MSNEPVKRPVPSTKKHVARLERERRQARLILYVFFGILATVVLLLVYGWLDTRYIQLQRPVAKVGDTNILVKGFEPRVRLQRQQLLSDYFQYSQYAQIFGIDVEAQLQQIANTLNSPLTIGQSVLDQMINEEIIRQEAAKRGITVSEAELNEYIQGEFSYFPNGTPTPSATPTIITTPELPAEVLNVITPTSPPSATPSSTATMASAATPASSESESEETDEAGEQPTLAPSATPTSSPTPEPEPTTGPTSTPFPTATPFTFEGYQSLLDDANQNLGKLGFSDDYYKYFFEVRVLEAKLREQITADTPRTELQVWARHILVSDEATANEVIELLRNGGDFGALAEEYSLDPGSRLIGGDLGWFGSGMMVAEFEAAAFALENSGDFTPQPVQSTFGFHIIQLVAKQERPLSPEDYEARKARTFSDWLATAREEYSVEIYDIWRQRIPDEPNFITAATESANAQLTQQAEFLETFNTPAP
jgi:peptidyl-prolyl cis-trans isomerase D